MHFLFALAALAGSATSTILWDGRFNDLTSSSDLNNWSWSSQVGPYQYYIHGTENVTSYVNLDSSYKNPADSGSNQGVKITLDNTSYWNGQTMRRTELIPQTTAAINSGKVWYHFSIMRSETNAPSIYREHQICFFESHFTELKSGGASGESGNSDPLLRWDVSSSTQWSTNWTAGVWHNVAYEIDFSAGSVAFYHSTGADDLTLAAAAVSVSASSDGADWHLGVLELPVTGQTDTTEDFYFSGVYVESGSLTTSVAGPGSAVVSSSGNSPSASASSPANQTSLSTNATASSPANQTSLSTQATATTLMTSTIAATNPVISSPVSSSAVAINSVAASSVATKSKKKCSSVTSSATAVAAVPTSTKKKCSSVMSVASSFQSVAAVATTASKKKCSSVTSSAATNVAASSTAVASSAGSLARYAQCGGTGWTGSGACVSGTTCTYSNDYYSQCL